jgi:chromosome segregation ATPase
MPVEMMSYADDLTFRFYDLASRLKASTEAARALARRAARELAKRLWLPKSRLNNGMALVSIDLADINQVALPARSPDDGHQAVSGSLKARIEILEIQLATVEAAAVGHRADFERERNRADQLMSELLKMTADAMTAKEIAARLDGELVALKADFERERNRADQLMSELLKMTADAMTAKETAARLDGELVALKARPWWRRLAG